MPVLITRASNNYGPYQFPEKLIPLMIANAIDGVPLPVYGDGLQVRDWLYVDDHCRGIWRSSRRAATGEVYNIGGNRALTNREVIGRVLEIAGAPTTLIRRVADRPGHDRRYALSGDKIARETGFVPRCSSRKGLPKRCSGTGTTPAGRAASDRANTAITTRSNYGWRTDASAAAPAGTARLSTSG